MKIQQHAPIKQVEQKREIRKYFEMDECQHVTCKNHEIQIEQYIEGNFSHLTYIWKK